MNVSLLVLGTLFILIAFGVGESVLKTLKINKLACLLIIAGFIVGVFLPPVAIFNTEVYFDKTVFPLFLSVVLLFKIKNFSRFVFSLLLSTLVTLLYSLGQFDTYTFVISPFIFLAVSLGAVVGLNSNNFQTAFSSLFFGINLGNIIFHLVKFETLESAFLEFNIFSACLIAWLVSALIVFSKQKISLQFSPKNIDYETFYYDK